MVAKSPESHTTVVPVAFNCSKELVMMKIFVFRGYIGNGEMDYGNFLDTKLNGKKVS